MRRGTVTEGPTAVLTLVGEDAADFRRSDRFASSVSDSRHVPAAYRHRLPTIPRPRGLRPPVLLTADTEVLGRLVVGVQVQPAVTGGLGVQPHDRDDLVGEVGLDGEVMLPLTGVAVAVWASTVSELLTCVITASTSSESRSAASLPALSVPSLPSNEMSPLVSVTFSAAAIVLVDSSEPVTVNDWLHSELRLSFPNSVSRKA